MSTVILDVYLNNVNVNDVNINNVNVNYVILNHVILKTTTSLDMTKKTLGVRRTEKMQQPNS